MTHFYDKAKIRKSSAGFNTRGVVCCPRPLLSIFLFSLPGPFFHPPDVDLRWLCEDVLRSGDGVKGDYRRSGQTADLLRLNQPEKQLMGCRTMMSTLQGKHNVTFNQADWQFGSCRFSRLCFWSSLPKPNTSQMTSVPLARTVPTATPFPNM